MYKYCAVLYYKLQASSHLLLAIQSPCLSSPLGKTLVCKYFATSTCIVSRLSVRRFRSHSSFSSQSPIGRKSVSSWVLPAQEAGRKEYICVSLASLTQSEHISIIMSLQWCEKSPFFPHHSTLLFIHSRRLLTWRGRCHSYINTSYLLIRTSSSFCFLDLSMDIANS